MWQRRCRRRRGRAAARRGRGRPGDGAQPGPGAADRDPGRCGRVLGERPDRRRIRGSAAVTPMVDAADRAGVTRALDEVRRWAEADLRDLSVAIVYGPVSAEDQLYLSKCPPGQLSVNALSAALDELGVRSEVLDPCRGAFIRDLTRFHVALSNLHGPFGEDGRLQG